MTGRFELGTVPFADLQDRQVAGFGDRPLLTFYDDGRGERVELSYKTFDNWVRKVANLLVDELGVEQGERVATVTGPHWQASAVHFACWRIGACAVPIDPDEPADGKAGILAAVGARVVFVREEWLAELRAVAGGLAHLSLVAMVADLFGNPAVELGRTPNFARIVPGMPDHYDGPTGGLDDPALTILASGSSAPAGVVLRQTDVLLRAAAVSGRWEVSELDRTMGTLPDHDVDGVVTTHLVPFGAGAGAVLQRRFDPERLWKRAADEKLTVLSLTSTQVEQVLEAAGDTHGLDVSRLRIVVDEGGQPSDSVSARWRERFGLRLGHFGPGARTGAQQGRGG
jgi:uncharacterized protein (TIGR03089 family)